MSTKKMWLRLKTIYASMSTLQVALGVSALVHVLLITVRFVDPEGFNRVFKDTPLEVILVNAKASEKLDDLSAQAQAIAQYRLNGGGEADKGLASSPMPSSQLTDMGTGAEQVEAQVAQLQAQQMLLLSNIKDQVAQLPKPDPKVVNKTERAEIEKKRLQLMKLLGAIERRINTENAKPKKRYISPATRQEAYALYYDDLRRKIERRGTDNFPTAAGRKLYGELTMLVTVNFDGRILNLEISGNGSGDKMLDARAKAIVQQAAPYGEFTQAMRRAADQLVVVSRFQFTKDQVLEAKVLAP
jgi:periplasmic protein TonB